MSQCPKCSVKGRHVGVLLPLEDPNGEVAVLHQCDGLSGAHGGEGSFQWWEPARDPDALLLMATDVQESRRVLVARCKKETCDNCPGSAHDGPCEALVCKMGSRHDSSEDAEKCDSLPRS